MLKIAAQQAFYKWAAEQLRPPAMPDQLIPEEELPEETEHTPPKEPERRKMVPVAAKVWS